jgi:aryl-alcohol dehydrogenase-like predicted oxidoreductase
MHGSMQVIKGNWQLSGGHRGNSADDRTRGDDALADFLVFEDAGITTFDTADIYGPSEALIGAYVRRRGGSEGLQLLTKSCKFGNDMLTVSQRSISEVCLDCGDQALIAHATHGMCYLFLPALASTRMHTLFICAMVQYVGCLLARELRQNHVQGISRSLQNMAVPSVDLVQFYWHDYSVPKYVEAAQYLMEEVAKGRVRHVGVTNFDVPRMQQMMDAGVVIASNQVSSAYTVCGCHVVHCSVFTDRLLSCTAGVARELGVIDCSWTLQKRSVLHLLLQVQYSLLDRRPENKMQGFCQANGIKLLPFGTVAGGFLSEKYLGKAVETCAIRHEHLDLLFLAVARCQPLTFHGCTSDHGTVLLLVPPLWTACKIGAMISVADCLN